MHSLSPEISATFLDYLTGVLGWSAQQIELHQTDWTTHRQTLLAPLTGKWIGLNSTGQLSIIAFPEENPLHHFDIAADATPVGTRDILFFNSNTGKPSHRNTLPENALPGILFTEQGTFLFEASLKSSEVLPEVVEYVDTCQKDKRKKHLDIFPVQAENLAFVSVREQGEIFAISMATHEIVAQWKLRNTASALAFNFTLDVSGKVLYITDSVSSNLHMIDLPSLNHRVYNSGLGTLGSLAAAPVQNKLYITLLHPEFNVIYFDMEKTRAEYSLGIHGASWTRNENGAPLPHDVFHELVGGNYIYISSLEGQPLLHLVDGEEIQVKRRTPLNGQTPPAIVARPRHNPYQEALAYDFEAHLLKHHHLTREQQRNYQHWLDEKEAERKAQEAAEREAELRRQKEAEDKILRRPRKQPQANPNFKVHQPPKQDESLWRLVDKPASVLDIPDGAEHAITDLIIWAFYRMTLTNLRIHAKELQRIQKISRRVKEELKQKQVVLAKIDNILGRHRFETPIDRNSVFKVLAQKKNNDDFYRIEDLCPLCETPFEKKVCPSCNFQLALPAHDELAGKAYSAEASDYLFPGQFLIPLQANKALMTLNIWRQPVQHIQEKGTLLKSIVDGLVLPHHNFLVVDHAGGKLVELSPSGEVVWKARLALKKPTRATFYAHETEGLRYIILDQGNLRILELDASGRHHRRYPNTRTPEPLKLKHPTDIQQLPNQDWLIADPGAQRILRVNTRGECLLEMKDGLNYPLMARQNYAGHLEVLDTEQKAWLLFDENQAEIGRFTFWPPPLVEDDQQWAQKHPPHWATRLHNGEWILMGHDYLMQMAPEEGLIRWISEIPNPQKEQSLLRVKFHTKSQAELQEERLNQHAASLKTIYGLNQVPEEKLSHLARHVKAISAKKGEVLLKTGTTGHAMYFILSGTLACIAPEPEKPIIFEVGESEIANAAAVVEAEKRTYKPGWIVQEDAQLLMIDRGDFRRAIMGFSALFQLVKQIHQDQQRRIRQFQERKTEALQDHLRSRIAEGLIKDFALFKQADKAFFEALSDVLQANAYMPDHAIFNRNESSGSMYFIFEGLVGVLRKGEVTPEVTLQAGDYFGEMALLTQQPRSTTVVTLDYCKMFELHGWQAQRLFQGYPWFKQALEKEAEKRQKENSEWVKKFARAAGVDRDDLPLVHVQPENFFPEEPPRYMCSVQNDAVLGFNPQGEVLWYWGQTPEEQLFHPHQVKVLENSLLVVDTGNDRVLEIDIASRRILRRWNKGLNAPVSADLTPEGFLLVANAGNHELVVSDNFGRHLWSYKAPQQIKNPCYVQITPQGTILFTDKALHCVYELQRNGEQVWSHGAYKSPGHSELQLESPAFALRMEDGSTLIGDAGNQRLVRVLQDDEIVITPLPVLDTPLDFEHVEVLPQGDIILYSFSQDRILRLGGSGARPADKIIWQAAHQFPLRTQEEAQPIEAQEPHWILDLETLQAEEEASQQASEAENSAESEENIVEDLAIAEQLSQGHWAGDAAVQPEAGAEVPPTHAIDTEHSEDLKQLDEALEKAMDSEDFTTAPQEESNPWEALAFLEDGTEDLDQTVILTKSEVIQTKPQDSDVPAVPEATEDTTSPWEALDFLNDTPPPATAKESPQDTETTKKSVDPTPEPLPADADEKKHKAPQNSASPWEALSFLDD